MVFLNPPSAPLFQSGERSDFGRCLAQKLVVPLLSLIMKILHSKPPKRLTVSQKIRAKALSYCFFDRVTQPFRVESWAWPFIND